jgi:hypothetical protein
MPSRYTGRDLGGCGDMSIQIYDFLDGSVLGDQDIPDTTVPEARLLAELEAYRAHILRNIDEIRQSLNRRTKGHRVFVAAASHTTVDRETLRRMALYFERAVIDDPLLPLSAPRNNAVSQFLGGQPPDRCLNRNSLAEAIAFLRAVRPMVAGGFLAIAPTGLANEPPAELPLLYSPTLFAERIPATLRDWFRNRAHVVRLQQTDRGWVSRDEPLTPCRTIGITFSGFDRAMMFQLAQTTTSVDPENPSLVTFMMQREAAAPPPEEFERWVTQSINQFAGNIYASITRDVVNASSMEAMLLTDSDLMVELLRHSDRTVNVDERTPELALQLDLPVLEQISEEDLMRVRASHPASLEAFRIQLERGLNSIAATPNESDRTRGLADLRRELTLKAREAELAFARLQGAMVRDVAIVGASLAATYFAGGYTALVALAAGRDAAKRWNDFRDSSQTAPGHFLFKLQQAARSSRH